MISKQTFIFVIISISLLFIIIILERIELIYKSPEQIHISLGGDESEMIVTWVTLGLTKTSTVWYGINNVDYQSQGTTHEFIDGGLEKRRIFIHRVIITGLEPGHKYRYICGSVDAKSSVFTFTTLKNGNDWSPRFAVYGDLGNVKGITLGRIINEVQRGFYDAILHVGDFAYDMHFENGRVGDAFMNQIQPMAAYLPYQVCPGNHENFYNFSNYDNRFSMVSKGSHDINNHYWSYDIGPAHIISFNTEFIYYTKFGTHQIENQYKWLEKDLMEANKPENRAQRPWIITMGHRPLYAQNHIDDLLRIGVCESSKKWQGFEDLFYKYGVDLEFYGHEHNYERLWPIYNKTVYNGSLDEPYTNPKAPVHIISGSAGCYETHTSLVPIKPFYTAFRIVDYGYTRMTIHNSTHIHIEQVSEDKHGEIVDTFDLIKEKHGPEAWL